MRLPKRDAGAGSGRALAVLVLLGACGCEDGGGSITAGDPETARARIRFETVNGTMAATPSEASASIESLAAFISGSFESGPERAYAVYRWVRDNIAVDYGQLSAGAVDPATQTAEEVFATRLAVCSGYSQLFAQLIESVGLSSVRIVGYGVMTTYTPGTSLDAYEHIWNGVELDGLWYLVEPSWDTSASLDGSDDPNFFFLTAPAEFAVRHFPYHSQWQLLDPPVLEADFWARLTAE